MSRTPVGLGGGRVGKEGISLRQKIHGISKSCYIASMDKEQAIKEVRAILIQLSEDERIQVLGAIDVCLRCGLDEANVACYCDPAYDE